ncbi:High affinity cAMP-specific and IBMX-insensitive 3',5'-cyclic phosphodiesterase 8B [Armadillidium nasatum]|uniref:3',5'-cyclic-AMP phosphodiesterase n=1 Tax=Armadillidium nasatum TaxID=96803 RepID=A0A5N5T5V0_9CRUS|nr:High affinity cAMP-specific and IBMX-insensitive 3',5'-cyclic phosphodiesterase 8B [Armadillidium nasatum]
MEGAADLIIVDARSSKGLKPESFCACVRSCDGVSSCVVVAIVKKSALERDSPRVYRYLNAGINRVLMESTTPGVVTNELIQLERGDLHVLKQQKILTAFIAALDSCKDLVHITDAQHRIQHINRACEAYLGYKIEDLYGKTIWEVHGSDHHRQELRTPSDVRSVDSLQTSTLRKKLSIDYKGSELTEIKEGKVGLDVSEAVNLQMRRGKEWEGLFSCRRKSGDIVHFSSKVTPVSCHSRQNEFFVYWSDGHHGERVEPFYARAPSIKSHRKGSYDIRSLNSDGERRKESLENELHGGVLSAPIQRDKFTFSRASSQGFREGSIIRRQSVAKLHNYMLEAPITRVVSIITAAQDSSPAYIAQALEKVLEILRSTELYNPQPILDSHTKSVTTDPVATDLLGALLSHSPKPLSGGRRSSSDQTINRLQNARPSLPASFQQASSAIKEILAEDLTWKFDIIKLEKLTDKRPLVWLGMNLMCQLNVPQALCCDEQTLQNWLTLIEANYQSGNSYHNSTHAADVLQTTAFFLEKERIKNMMDPLDAAACLIAAAVHDVDHPGKNSQFLCNTNNELAILYNDQAVLESHHAAVTFKLTASDDRVNILKGLDLESYKFVRKNVIDMVLATDMAKHFEHVNKFINMLDKCVTKIDDDGDQLVRSVLFSQETIEPTVDLTLVNTSENIEIIKRMMIKCADINNPLRPIHLCVEWANRIANEYFNQTEEEKRRKIPVVMPQFDRTTCSIPKSQIGFIDFFIFDMFEAWHELAQIPELMGHLKENYHYWKEMDERERKTLTASLELKSPSSGGSQSNLDSSLKVEEGVIVEELT